MIKAVDVIGKIEQFAPLELQESYDNSGLQVGSLDTEVTGIYIALNLDLEVINDAKSQGCNFILVHHPLIFNPIKAIDLSTYQGKLIQEVIKNDIVVYAGHTSVDNMEDSIAVTNLSKLGCSKIHRVEEVFIAETNSTVKEIADKLTRLTGDKNILHSKDKAVNKVAYINGSGGRMEEILPLLKDNDVDLYISSEFKYSFLLELTNNNIAVIELNHFNSEQVFIEIMKNKLCTSFDRVVMSTICQNPYNKE